jgi:CHAD domain-containing protein
MARNHREVEDKYDVDGDATLPRLDAIDGVSAVGDPVTHELEATYFDTEELTLAGAGITIRRRTGGEDAGWHLKLPAAEGRHEVRLPPGRAVRTVPKELRTAVQGFVRGRRLGPVATLRTRRTVRSLLDADGAVLAEVADDEVTAEVPTGDGEAGPESWREWEVELVDGGSPMLAALAPALREAGARPATAASKLARALGDRAPTGPTPLRPTAPRLRRKSPASAVIGWRLTEQAAELRRLDPLVRRDVPDAVHKMRVAMRRLRSALATYRPFVDREVTDPLREELKWIAGVLGEARDTEVIHARIDALVATEQREHPDLVGRDVMPLVDRVLGEHYRAVHDAAVAAMESERYFALLDRLDAVVADPPWTGRAARPAKAVLPARVERDYRRLRRRVRAAAEAEDPHQHDALLHEVRKAAKRARYAAETLVPVYGRDAERFVEATKRVQSVLGDHHDSVVSRQDLRELSEIATEEGVNAFTFGVLHAREDEAARGVERKFDKAWAKASQPKRRSWLP